MNNDNVSGSRLARLYRRCTRARVSESLPDVDALLALADGERTASAERLVADVGRSGVHADLLRFARALAPESARLGVQVEQAFDAATPAHRRGDQRNARRAGARPAALRFVASLAAAVIVGVAVWGLQQRHASPPVVARSAPAASQPPDRIFAALDTRAQRSNGDRIFRAEFSPDQIFKGKFNRG